jgi:hypothetical protein
MKLIRLAVPLTVAILSAACQPPAPAAEKAASIRHVDFANLSYAFPGGGWTLRDSAQEAVRRNGIIREPGYLLDTVAYGDVTGDGRDDALVVVGEVTGGSAVPHWVFAYTDGPRQLWAFQTGDRSAGGLKDVYAKDGMLVVELFGRDKVPGSPERLTAPDGSDTPACCPAWFTRSRHAWNGRAFELRGTPEVLPYDPAAD